MMMIMEGLNNKVGGGGGGDNGGGGVDDQDMGEGMQCSDHPYRNNPGGICAFCLQDKLGKLLSSSSSSSSSKFNSSSAAAAVSSIFPAVAAAAAVPSSSSSSPPSFRSETTLSLSTRRPSSSSSSRRGRIIPFGLPQKKKKKDKTSDPTSHGGASLKRSKSTATPRRCNRYLDDDAGFGFGPKPSGGFWSFFYLTTSKPTSSVKKISRNPRVSNNAGGTQIAKLKENTILESAEESESPNASSSSSFSRKVSRSRSVGCGSRSFSGDFFERISTGFGDCTLRRVESQREGKLKAVSAAEHHHCIKERVRCGGIFGGFNLTSSSSSSSSSSYWVSTSAEEINGNGRATATTPAMAAVHGRSKSWGWALASPMRAFSKPSSSKEGGKRKNATPNLAAVPSLLAVRS